MRILYINTVCGTGSTGRIVVDLYKEAEKNGDTCMVGYGRGTAPYDINGYRIGNDIDMYCHALLTRITDKTAFYSKHATRKFLEKVDEFKPDLIHLHNLHGYYIDIEMLFNYIKEKNIKVVWTLHDCWSFTGHCAHFDYVGCQKWKTGCYKCPQKNVYPKSSLADASSWNYEHKKNAFCGVKDMTIITPSKWLADLVKESFLREYEVCVLVNGIDFSIFNSIPFNDKKKEIAKGKKIVLGVTSVWNERKGSRDYIELAKNLPDQYVLVIVGVPKEEHSKLPLNIIAFEKTKSIQELIEFYKCADVYFNASLEETMGMTTIEALICGLPVITFDRTAVPEFVPEVKGIVVKAHDIEGVKNAIKLLSNKKSVDVTYAIQKFEKNIAYKKYLEVYRKKGNLYYEK